MAPVPKGLSAAQVVRWRRAVALGYRPTVATIIVKRKEFLHPTAVRAQLPFSLPAFLS